MISYPQFYQPRLPQHPKIGNNIRGHLLAMKTTTENYNRSLEIRHPLGEPSHHNITVTFSNRKLNPIVYITSTATIEVNCMTGVQHLQRHNA